ncbi:Tad domain-containing protein [Sphingomonas sp. SUN019]|nr:Tad domain-containing protein [Sphingomonas sp. SUN019]
MMAIAMVPMSALAGSAVDMARLYVVKVRLQQACDAGVLAGRKFMTDSNDTTLDTTAAAQAKTFFDNNFKSGWMNTKTVSFVPNKTTDRQVAGVASAVVPMTVMKMFAAPDTTLNVTCEARYDIADTDIMFVLDTTGSMACLPSDSASTCSSYAGSATKVEYTRPTTSGGVAGYAGTIAVGTTERAGSRIDALREAVLGFYDTMVANADPSTHIRYGFVTYSSAVNVGQAILDMDASYMVGGDGSETQTYQSRVVNADVVTKTVTDNNNNGKSSTACTASARTPSTAKTYAPSTGTASRTYDFWSGSVCQTRTDTLIPQWQYRQAAFDVSQVVAGNVITDPTKVHGQTTRWAGCIESTVDSPGTSTFSTTSLPSELNPDIVPTGAQRWWPYLADLTYYRYDNSSDGDDVAYNPNYGVDPWAPDKKIGKANYTKFDRRDSGSTACGKPAKRLGVMTRTDVDNFVNATDFVPMGGTYHDIGMIWGTRLISPTGIWASDTAAWPGRGAPNRVIVFLTDGDMAPNTTTYGMYGIETYDKRVAGSSGTDLTTLHNARFLAACEAAKARQIDVWTVAIDTSSSTELQSCASSTAQALFSTTGTGLSDAFKKIAKQVAMLRVSK